MGGLDTKTRWHVDVPDVPATEQDPFEQAGEPVEQAGLPISLTGNEALLNEKLVDLVNSEAELRQRGVRCPIRDRNDSTCSACPISHADEMGHPLATLCRIGRDQERTVMELHVLDTQQSDAQADAA